MAKNEIKMLLLGAGESGKVRDLCFIFFVCFHPQSTCGFSMSVVEYDSLALPVPGPLAPAVYHFVSTLRLVVANVSF